MWNDLLEILIHEKVFLSYLLFLFLVLYYFGDTDIDSKQFDLLTKNRDCIFSNCVEDSLLNVKGIRFEEHEKYGGMGKPVLLWPNWINESKTKCEEQYGYNKCVSDLISLNRTLPDFRHEKCKDMYGDDDAYPFDNDFVEYPEMMTSVSVIIIFYNEAWTTLLRTIHSLLNRSPTYLLEEIILVDNGSTKIHLKSQLKTYLKGRLFGRVHLFRTHRRLGVMNARIFAAEKSTGSILIFLDPCCEATRGWLQPLVNRLINSENVIAVPVIDKINKTTFEFQPQNLNHLFISGFNWNLDNIPLEIIRKNDTDMPFRIPIISHGIFAIKTDYFFNIIGDRFDYVFNPEVNDLEISFQTWMCGGIIETVPCSRIGFVFGKKIIVSLSAGREENSIHQQKARIAEVWMDEYKKFYYQQMGNSVTKIGDVLQRKSERKNCKLFQWYLNYVYPQLKPIESNFTGELQYLHQKSKLCLQFTDHKTKNPANDQSFYLPVNLYPCHGKGGNQFWIYSKDGKIRQNSFCLSSNDERSISLVFCSDSKNRNEIWSYNHNSKQIYHKHSRKYLAVSKEKSLFLENGYDHHNHSWSFNEYKYIIVY